MLITIVDTQNKVEHSKGKEKREEQRTLAEPTSPLYKQKNKEQGYGTNYKMEDRQKYWKTDKP
jgi:hypothetical protein